MNILALITRFLLSIVVWVSFCVSLLFLIKNKERNRKLMFNKRRFLVRPWEIRKTGNLKRNEKLAQLGCEAATELNDVGKLSKIVYGCDIPAIVQAALKRLEYVAVNATDTMDICRTLEILPHSTLTEEILRKQALLGQQWAIERITDMVLLKEIVLRKVNTDACRTAWKKLDLSSAREVAQEMGVSVENICVQMGAHCNAPGPISHCVEENWDTGFVEHESFSCLLCDKPVAFRSKSTIVGSKWPAWKYCNLRQGKFTRLPDGGWMFSVPKG